MNTSLLSPQHFGTVLPLVIISNVLPFCKQLLTLLLQETFVNTLINVYMVKYFVRSVAFLLRNVRPPAKPNPAWSINRRTDGNATKTAQRGYSSPTGRLLGGPAQPPLQRKNHGKACIARCLTRQSLSRHVRSCSRQPLHSSLNGAEPRIV